MEYVAAYRAMRDLASALAQTGVAALRLDYFATGDSGGDTTDVNRVSQWTEDVRAATSFLRQAGVSAVGWVGMRVGALIAAGPQPPGSADAGRADFQVLWDPCLSGARYLRESTLLARQVLESAGPHGLPEAEESGLIGYHFAGSLLESLSELRLGPEPPGPGPTLLLTRNGELPAALAGWAGPAIEVGPAEGQEELLVRYLDIVRTPEAAVQRIAGWCRKVLPDASDPVRQLPAAQLKPTGLAWREEVQWVGKERLFAVLTTPAGTEPQLATVFFSAGAQHRVGPNRLYVDAARRLAADGIASVRVDLRSIGDSPPGPGPRRALIWPAALDDMDEVMAWIARLQTPVATTGLCSGAYHALEAAARHRVRGALALHPILDQEAHSNWPELLDPRRRIWVRDRGWVRLFNRRWRTKAWKKRLPEWVWRVCHLLRVQPELSSGVRDLAARGEAEVTLLMETARLSEPRLFALRGRLPPRLRIIPSQVDHALVSPSGRAWVLEVLVDQLRAWRDHPRPD
jgi:dienelactone hydrolase